MSWSLYDDLPPPTGTPTSIPVPTVQSVDTSNIVTNQLPNQTTANEPISNSPVITDKKSIISEWSVEAKLLGQQLKRKNAAATTSKAVPAKVVPRNLIKPSTPRVNKVINNDKAVNQPSTSTVSSNHLASTSLNIDGEQYDPIRPNDYLALIEERKNKVKQQEEINIKKAREQAEASAKSLNKDFQPPALYSQNLELPPPVEEAKPTENVESNEDIDGVEYEGEEDTGENPAPTEQQPEGGKNRKKRKKKKS